MTVLAGSNKVKNEAIRFALEMGKKKVPHYSSGGVPRRASGGVVGPLIDAGPGRTDTLPISVPPGSYVVPADVVSGLPGAQGNSLAGHLALEKLMHALPLVPDEAPYGASGTSKLPRASTIPGLANMHHLERAALDKNKGGRTPEDHGEPIEIMAAGGEHVISPEHVRRLGMGDLSRGHAILDDFVKEVRKRNIKDLRKLPPPVKDGTK